MTALAVATFPFLPSGLARLVTLGPGACWTWRGRVDRTGRGAGYGRIGRAERAHLIVYTLLVGPIGRARELDHLCRNRACVNPAHLEPVTHAENMRRLRLERCKRGHPLTPSNVAPSGALKADGTRGRTCRTCLLARRKAARAAGRNA